MTDQSVLDSRRADLPSIDELSAIVWTREMGKRLAIARMKMLLDQRELADLIGVTQATISRIERGHLAVNEQVTVAKMKAAIGTSFPYVVFGLNPERFNEGRIIRLYWDSRLRERRRNKGPYSKSRVL